MLVELRKISHGEALTLGLKHYFTGKPCKRGHISARRVSSMVCCQCAASGLKWWRHKNKDRYRKAESEYRSANRSRIREQERIRYARDKEKFTKKSRNYYSKNADLVRSKRRSYHHASYENPNVRAAAQARTREWSANNPDKVKVNARNGKIRRKSVHGTHTAADERDIYESQRGKCAYCRVRLRGKYHLDHIHPVSRGGSNNRKNLQILCAPCNLRKGASDPLIFSRKIGLLI